MPGVCRVLVKPTVPPAVRSWPLSAIDRFAFQWVIQGVWVFDAFLDPSALKQGLARLLDTYPILCGRVMVGKLVEWRDDGVPFVEAEMPDVSVADFDAATVDAAGFAESATPGQIRAGRAPLLMLTLTRIADGSVLGISASHACLDGNGFYSLARNFSLAATHRPFPTALFERPTAAPKRGRGQVAREARRAGWHKSTPLDLLRFVLSWPHQRNRVFVAHFSPAALARCKAELAVASGCERLSTNSALVAHVAHCVAKLVGLGPNSCFAISSVIDTRERVSGLAENFAGNAAALAATLPIPAHATASEIAARLHDRLQPLLGRPSAELETTAGLTEEVAAHGLWYSAVRLSPMLGRKPTLFYTNSFVKFPVYDVDFGDAARPIRPVRVVPHNLGDPILFWPAPPTVGGVDLYFSGNLARAIAGLDANDSWWEALRRFDHA
jgi:Transferase family